MKKKFVLWLSIWLSLVLAVGMSETTAQDKIHLDNDTELIAERSRKTRSSRSGSRCGVECKINRFSPEVLEVLHDARVEFGIDGHRFNRIVACESGGNPNATNGSHDGLTQQSRRYWAGRVRAFNAANEPDVGGDIRNARDNARVGAWMMSHPDYGFGHWSCKG